METVAVQAGTHRYEVLIGPGLIEQAGSLVRPFFPGRKCAVIADASVAPVFGEQVIHSLREAAFAPESFLIEASESAKSMPQAAVLCEKMSGAGLDRSSFILSLGGGVIGDLAGFVAAIFLRGIPYVSIPTTLLAQLDSCIGGKTGVNSAAGKNLIGAFHHPSLVLADTDTLQTLPERIWNAGFAEAIKHAVIRDAGLFDLVDKTDRRNPSDFIARNLAIKAELVAADERERVGTRALLNFGHTIGHGIEYAADYQILHGEAISLGMVAAAHVSVRQAGLSLAAADRIVAALRARQLPTVLPKNFPRQKILEGVARDKKFESGRIRFVVAHEIGRASVSSDVTAEDLRAAVEVL